MGALSDSIGGGGGITIEEAEGPPSVSATVIKYPNNSLTIVGTTVSVDTHPAPSGIDGPTLNAFSAYLKAGWTFNDAGAPIDDSVGVNYQLALDGGSPTFLATGKNGTSIQGSAGVSYSRPSAGFNPGLTGQWTVNSWVYVTSVGTYPILLTWNKDATHSHILYLHNTNNLTWSGNSGAGSQYAYIGAFTGYLNKWTMITWKRTFTAPSTYLQEVYLDGAFFGSYDDAAIPDDLSGYNFQISGNNSTHKQDEVLFWNEAISSAAITELYNSGTGLFLTTIGAPSGLGFSHADLVGFNQYLVSYWKFEEAGTPLVDSISNNSLAATGSPTFSATGKNGNCVELNAASLDSLSRTGTFTHSASQEYSMSYWVYVNSSPASLGVFHEFYTGFYAIERVGLTPTNTIQMFRAWAFGGSGNQTFTGTTTLTASTWYHISIVKTQIGALYQRSLYINGAFEGSDTADANSLAMNTAGAKFTLGAHQNLTTLNFTGRIDELAYWKGTALDSAAVTALYNAGAGRFLESV